MLQIDTAATCNTMSLSTLRSFLPDADLKRSPYRLYPYGNSKPLEPEGQVDLVCERQDGYVTLTFQILPDSSIGSKPALLSGSDSERLGLITVHPDEIHSLSSEVETTTAEHEPPRDPVFPTMGCTLESCRNDSGNTSHYGLQPSSTTP